MKQKLTPKQLKAAILYAEGLKGTDIAKSISVTPQTISEWKNNPAFKAEINKLKWDALCSARDRIQGLAGDAVDSIQELLKAENEEVRRKACRDVFELIGLGGDPQTYGQRYGWGIDFPIQDD